MTGRTNFSYVKTVEDFTPPNWRAELPLVGNSSTLGYKILVTFYYIEFSIKNITPARVS